jgi:general secretion pathway protein B
MSFILDALRKSEHDRQRQSGPGLAEIPVAVAKPKVNVWATAAIALLIVNLVAVGVVLLRRAHDTGTGSTEAASAVSPANGSAAPTPASPVTVAAPQASLTQTRPQPTLQDPPPTAQGPSARNPLEGEMSAGGQDIDAGMATQAASVPAGPPAVSRAPSGRGRVVYAPTPEAAEQSAAPSAAQSIEQAGLPTADEVTSRGGVPELHLDLHVFSTRAQDRFIFVNSRKYREGDTLQEGPVVEQITEGGAVLNYRGSRFVLSRD